MVGPCTKDPRVNIVFFVQLNVSWNHEGHSFFNKLIRINYFLEVLYCLCRIAVSYSAFSYSVVSHYIDYTGTLTMLHIRSKLFIYIWMYLGELCFCTVLCFPNIFLFAINTSAIYYSRLQNFFLNQYFPFVCIIWII